jgi:hypothetical protein
MRHAFWVLALAFCNEALGRVVIDVTTKDLESGAERDGDRLYVQGPQVRVETAAGPRGQPMVVIFKDETFFMLDPGKKSYMRMDAQTMEQLSSTMSEAMKEMQERMAQLPPAQRAMIEERMKGAMGGMGGMAGGMQPPRVESGSSSQVGDYSCQMYTVYRGDEKSREICAVSPDQVEGLVEAMEGMRGMARFADKLREAMAQGPMAGMSAGPLQVMDEIQGFPVLTREFEGGKAVRETLFRSAAQQDLGAELFSVPSDYTEQQLPMPGGPGGRPGRMGNR